ncbi:MAG TPA: SUMF1/EgtB/PvdO family nonheme iron enzyme, partial [Gemmataceae bacterium]|nr:SUMF1/EgtB/PvdO family nonheme iron enzyme [Gemmataceae bacterium]
MNIDPKRVKEIFLEAAELSDAAARAAYLDQACGADAGVRERVEALLRSHDPEGSFLGTPAAVVPDPDHAATCDVAPAPDHVAATATTDGRAGASDDEPLTFLAPPTRPDALGRIGHYEVLQVLGKGGFGIVFRAFDEMLQRVVALKVMAPQLAATSPARKRFLREARSSAQVRHENVVQVYEVAEQPLPYLAMEFIPGETLQQKLNRLGPLDVPEVLRIGRQIAEGLAAAHATDLIHRDIKPGNVLLEGGHHKVKITDFGLARAADDASISQSGIIAGTPMYMAPEQAEGHTLDQRADLFSLGSVLYQMVSGRPPFRANTTVAVLKRVAEDKPRPIREIIPETPQWLCDIIAKLHAKNPDDRYQSAREVADVLADCEAQLKANSKLKDYSRIPRSKPRRFGRRKWAAVAAVLLLPVIVLGVTEFAGVTHLLRLGLPKKGADQPGPAANAAFDAKEAQEASAKQLGIPVETTNSIGMKLRFIPAGKFMMGSSKEEIAFWLKQKHDGWYKELLLSEGPQHEVEITQPFCMGQTDVTVGQFRQFVKSTGYKTQAEREGGAVRGFPNGAFKDVANTDWLNPGFAQTDDRPVVCVSWNDAVEFCRWLSKQEGKTYRLPTEAEWEYSCRAGSRGRWSFGDDEAELCDYARVGGNSRHHSWPVAGLKANAWGLYDMHGNVEQWCQELFDPNYYKTSPPKDPPGPPAGDERVARGGFWLWDAAWWCRSAMRHKHNPAGRANFIGFRVVLVVSSPKTKTPPLAVGPFTDADVQRIAALPAAQQIEEVRKELKRRNPGFDGKMETKIEGGVVTEFGIVTDHVTDIAPIRVWSALRVLKCGGTHAGDWQTGFGQLADLTPLKGMNLSRLTYLELSFTDVADAGMVYFEGCKKLTFLALTSTRVSDRGLAHFKDCKYLSLLSLDHTRVTDVGLQCFRDCPHLKELYLAGTQVTDGGFADFSGCTSLRILNLGGTQLSDAGLAHFKDSKNLSVLFLEGTKVGDAGLANLKGVPLRMLSAFNTGITDLTSLQGMPLQKIRLTPKNITKGLDILRDMKSLKTIGIAWKQAWPAAEFWQRYDKGEFK